jgi:hypothetical protein
MAPCGQGQGINLPHLSALSSAEVFFSTEASSKYSTPKLGAVEDSGLLTYLYL